jgi:chromate transporter
MIQDSTPAAAPPPHIPPSPPPTLPGLLELFVAFAKMSLAGFGGVLVWARRGIVDQHRWMTAGLVCPPMVVAIILAALYSRYGEIDALRRILGGITCAAVGLLIAVVFKMATPLFKRGDVIGLLILVAVFVAIGVARLPLPMVLLVAIPLSLAITVFVRRGGKT